MCIYFIGCDLDPLPPTNITVLNATDSGVLVTWSIPGPPFISAHAYWMAYWPEVDVNVTYVISYVTTNDTNCYINNLLEQTLYNIRV